MEKVKPRTLTGFMELLPGEQIEFDRFTDVLKQSYIKYGFYPLDTPVLESSAVLLAKAGGETEKQIYRFKKGDTDLTMRFDLTVPLAKYAALHYNELNFPFKRYQIGKVYRGERAQKGRFREFYQADIDIIGDGELSIVHDAEIPAVIYDIFSTLGIGGFKIRINNRKLLSGFFELQSLSERIDDVLRTVDKLDKIGRDGVMRELGEIGVSDEAAADIIAFVNTEGTSDERLAAAEKYAGKNETFDKGLEELKTVVGYVRLFGVPDDNFTVDFAIARGLDYYTGTVYETVITEHPEFGSVCSGGRYDNLAEFYTDKKLPGVGISIGVTRLFSVLKETGFFDFEKASPVDALIIPMTQNMGYCISVMKTLREKGVRVQTYFEDKKLKKKMTYANRINAPYAVIIGDDEIAAGKVALKNLDTGEQTVCTAVEAAAIITE
ncbi:MAG TPA: histidine--tRNA ligase [Candidatus Ornithomonoglobus intestinigallinarum]|uniref:Histidine--tRNA ligase n=1 Tax=Candidatus Ornithomonoglobus intestinigallinarum TaxID=2840894 RepID=A0A9D1KR17_9FIRM|nr:histidine--tRNA ligase [Candidatus Ornithomonoglobus intestinigallinarum]